MKKRVLSILLCLCMVLTLLPTAAFAAVEEEPAAPVVEEPAAPAQETTTPAAEEPATLAVEEPATLAANPGELDVNDGSIVITATGYTQGDAAPETEYTGNYVISGDSSTATISISGQAEGRTITLSGLSLTGTAGSSRGLLEANGGVALQIEGDVSLKSGGTGRAIYGDGNLTITGTGSLTLESTDSSAATVDNGNLSITLDGNITANSSVSAQKTTLISTGGEVSVTASGAVAAVNVESDAGSVVVEGKTGVTLKNTGSSNAVYSSGAISITSSDGAVTLTAAATDAVYGTQAITVTGAGAVTVESTGSSQNSCAINQSGEGDVTVESTGASVTVGSKNDRAIIAGGPVSLSAKTKVSVRGGSATDVVINASKVTFAAQDGAEVVNTNPSATGALIDPNSVATVSVAEDTTLRLLGGNLSLNEYIYNHKVDAGSKDRVIIFAGDASKGYAFTADTKAGNYLAGSGTALWEPVMDGETLQSATLTLTDATINTEHKDTVTAVTLPDIPVTVVLNGTNNISASSLNSATGFDCSPATTFDLTAGSETTVTANGRYAFVLSNGDITIKGSGALTLNAPNANENFGIQAKDGTVTLAGGTLSFQIADASTASIDIRGTVILDGVTIPAGETLNLTSDKTTIQEFKGGTVVNGTLVLGADTDVAAEGFFDKFSGTGLIKVGEVTYFTNGEKLITSTTPLDFTSGDHSAATLDKDGYTWTGDAETGYTLTLQNLNLTVSGLFVNAITLPDADCKLILKGTNTLNNTTPESYSIAINSKGSFTISGDGALKTENKISTEKSLTIKGGEVIANDIIFINGDFVISGGTVTLTTNSGAALGAQNVTISGGTVTASTKNGNGINAGETLTISGGSVTASGIDEKNQYGCGLAASGDIIISGGSVTAKGIDTAIWSKTGITLTGMRITNPTGAVVGVSVKDPDGKAILLNGKDVLDVTIEKAPVTPPDNGGNGGGSSSGGGSDSSDDDDSSSSGNTTAKPDGSTTTTTTDKTTGTITETTKKPDGSTTTVETKKDGTVTTVDTKKDGSTTESIQTPDGSVSTTETRKDGVKTETKTDPDGKTTATVTVPEGKDKVTVTIPTPEKPTAGTVAVIVKPDGTKEVVKTSVADKNGVKVTLPEGATLEIIDNSKPFGDVKPTDWHADAVAFVTSRELFTGTGEDTFDPDAKMTRAMLMTVLYRFDGATVQGEGDAWYADAQAWAKEVGISDGTNPEVEISREQLATILYRYAKGTPATADMSKFTDAGEISDFASEAMNWAVEQGILQGNGGRLNPKGSASRSEVATMLMRYCENAAN